MGFFTHHPNLLLFLKWWSMCQIGTLPGNIEAIPSSTYFEKKRNYYNMHNSLHHGKVKVVRQINMHQKESFYLEFKAYEIGFVFVLTLETPNHFITFHKNVISFLNFRENKP